ncbi:hypothetical protein ASG41_04090 [Modestobacter sp. Leaf380]|nr:hypothetical protein ASG41_04090 [Modestobacter sp. Leaf380]
MSTVTVWSPDPGALARVEAAVAAPDVDRRGLLRRTTSPGSVFSLETIVPSGMDVDAWDWERAVQLWGTARPETDATLDVRTPDRLVYRLVTAFAPPSDVLRALSAAHPGVVVHVVTTCESEYASTAWYLRGTTLREEETGLDLTDEQWEDWDGEWDLPPRWAFAAATARELAG